MTPGRAGRARDTEFGHDGGALVMTVRQAMCATQRIMASTPGGHLSTRIPHTVVSCLIYFGQGNARVPSSKQAGSAHASRSTRPAVSLPSPGWAVRSGHWATIPDASIRPSRRRSGGEAIARMRACNPCTRSMPCLLPATDVTVLGGCVCVCAYLPMYLCLPGVQAHEV